MGDKAMIDRKDVPNEVAKAAWEYFDGYDMKEAIAAALNAWPGAQESGMTMGPYKSHIYILPLPQEPRDE